jgi:VWFA-related protein
MAAEAGAPVKRAVAAIFAALSIAVPGAAQQPLFRAAVDVVRVDLSVMNGRTAVGGLTREHFEVTDNGVPQTIEAVSIDSVPLDLTLVLDSSGSLAGDPLKHLIDAAHGLVKALKTEDAVSLITFSEPVRQVVPATRDRAPVLKALTALKADGQTSVNDAVFFALQTRPPQAGESRTVLLVFSDGRDTSSWLNDSQTLEAAKRSGMVIQVIELVTERWMDPALGGLQPRSSQFLNRLAATGGGRSWLAESPGDLRALFGKVLNELRARYVLTYSPTGVSREGWHDVKVTLKNTRGEVTARPGYFAR